MKKPKIRLKEGKGLLRKIGVYAIAAVLVAGVVLGTGIWLSDVDVPISYEEPYSIEMSESETDDYMFETIGFKETTEWAEADFEENSEDTQDRHYHQHVSIDNPANTGHVAIKAIIEEPTGWNDQMGFTIYANLEEKTDLIEPYEEEIEVDEWSSISHTQGVPEGETIHFTVVYSLGFDAPEPNEYEVRWTFEEADSETVTADDDLQQAINDAEEGTTLFVEGENNPYEPVEVNTNDITLYGVNNPTIDGDGEDGYGVHIRADEVTLQGFTVTNAKSGVVVDGASDCLIYDVIAEDNDMFGVMIQGIDDTAEHNTVRDVTARNNVGQHGIAIEYDANHNEVIDCTAYGNGGNGFGINREAENNIITGGEAYDNGLGGVGIFSGPWRAPEAEEEDDPYGPQGNTVENVDIYENDEFGISIKTSDADYEDEDDNDGGEIVGNTIGPNNEIYDNPVGIEVIDGNEHATITGLDIIYNDITVESEGTGIEVDDVKGEVELTVNIQDNDFDLEEDTTDEVYVLDVEEILDLEAVLEDNIFPDGAMVVDNRIEHHETIQSAVDSADDRVLVGPGDYTGFDANVEGLEIVAVEPRESVITNEIVTISAQGVILDGFLVEDIPRFETPVDAAGILVTASDVTVRNNRVRGLEAEATESGEWLAANGIQVFNDDETEEITDITIENNLVETIDSYGYETDSYGAGSAGIKVQGNVRNVEVRHNEVRDISSEGWSWGITVTDTDDLDPKEVTINMNSIEDLSADELYGIAFGSEADASEVTIYENNAWTASDDDMDYGVENKDDTMLDAGNNFWNTEDDTEIIYDPDDKDNVDLDQILTDPVDGAGTDW